MHRRHPALPQRWLVTDPRLDPCLIRLIRQLPRGTGVLVRHHHLPPRERRALVKSIRRAGRTRNLLVVDEAGGEVARVHSAREIAQAQLRGARILFISPLFATRTHPDWVAMPRMKAASLARLTRSKPLALGGLDAARFRQIAPLGFGGWGAIDAWLGLRR